MDDFESVVDYSIFHRAMVNISHWESLAVGYSRGRENWWADNGSDTYIKSVGWGGGRSGGKRTRPRAAPASLSNEISRGTGPIGRSNRNKQCYEFKRLSLAPP